MANLNSTFKKEGSVEGTIHVDISYDIIRHVSAQLYTNPRKAIEELVCNGYDAGASECHVSLPSDSRGALLVLDNGTSMSFGGLQDLWRVADSPKKPNAKGQRIANNRLQIGKFGVGKLAAYALGKRLTHVATVGGKTRVVSVGENEIRTHKGGPPTFDVYTMAERKARVLLEPFLQKLPRPWDEGWDSWTLAIVENIGGNHFQRALRLGILKRMISTALPLSARFTAFLDGEAIPKREVAPADIEVTIDVLDPAFRKKLEADLQEYWQAQLGSSRKAPKRLWSVKLGKMPSPENVKETVPAIIVPELGAVSGNAIIARQTLTTEKLVERGYVNHGFAVYAYGKLINPEDELFGISARSHAYWRRFLARVEIPGLDDILLVQRNAVSEDSPKAQVAREVMRVLFEYARSKAEVCEEADDFKPQAFGSKIQRSSPILGPLAFGGLGGGKLPDGGVSEVDIDYVALNENGPASRYDLEEHNIQINEDHPIVDALKELGSERQKLWRRVMGEVIAGGKLTEGLLTARGIDERDVRDAEELMDSALRSAASYIRDPVEEHVQEILDASFIGGKRFENAVVNAFKSLRLVSNHLGGPDKPDGTVEVPRAGEKNLRISIEAKGTKGVITHAELQASTVERHRGEEKCTSSVAIAREFQTEGRNRGASGLLKETEGKIPLLTVDGIAKMLRLHQRRRFTYDKVATILTTFTHPDRLEDFIEKTWRELPEPGLMKLVLQVAHEKCREHDNNFPDPGMLVDDPRLRKHKVTKPQIRHILEAVAVTTSMVVIKDQDTYEFSVMAPVDTITEAMTAAANEEVPSDKPMAK